MQWNSIGEFFVMGGYALYVWGSFAACLVLMIAEPLLAKHRQNVARQTLVRERLADELEKSTS